MLFVWVGLAASSSLLFLLSHLAMKLSVRCKKTLFSVWHKTVLQGFTAAWFQRRGKNELQMGKLSPPSALKTNVKHDPRKKQQRGNHSCVSQFGSANHFCLWEVFKVMMLLLVVAVMSGGQLSSWFSFSKSKASPQTCI